MNNEKLSKIVSHALRHKPSDYNLILSKDGWASIDDLVKGLNDKFTEYSNLERCDIEKMVYEQTKKRHEIKDGNIKALHGHSLEIEINCCPSIPPSKLFHATALKYIKKIKKAGLDKMGRNFVHLSIDPQTANEVASNKYKDVILLQIDTNKASNEGILFYSNDSNVTWLCKNIPPQYISIVIE